MSHRFSWESFPIDFLKAILYGENTPKRLRPPFDSEDLFTLLPYMDAICVRPDAHFIRRYRREIMDHFLADSTHLPHLVRQLEKYRTRNIQQGSMEEMLNQLKGCRLTSTLITLIQAELLQQGRCVSADEQGSVFQPPKRIDLEECIANPLPLFPYQEKAVAALIHHFFVEEQQAGVLVMPTGSGKTRVATRFLLQEAVGRGYHVLWLTHRSMLIEQAADSIYTASPIVKLEDHSRKQFKMVCISGQHATSRAIEADDDVVIGSVQSLCRNLDFLQVAISPNMLIVVDEAHHALAPSYRRIIRYVRQHCPSAKLLGLTATPVRMTEGATNQLMELFDRNYIYSISMSDLIASGVMAQPKYIQIDTHVDFKTTVDLEEQKYIQRWGELSPGFMEEMAQIAERNELIVQTYLAHRKEYGKTLIFALNGVHCISLCEELQKHGVRCDYIYSAHAGNQEKIDRFRRNELEVLVNINVMTEGSDVPDIQTVFLTRPTSSDVLLMQMIGRGMRGQDCGGTAEVNIVDFHDMWGSFAHWLSPQFFLTQEEDVLPEYAGAGKRAEMVPWQRFRDVFDGIKTTMAGDLSMQWALPVGWYDGLDEDGTDTKVLVFEDQLDGYQAMEQREDLLDVTPEMLQLQCFSNMGLVPSQHDLTLLLEDYRIHGAFPQWFTFTQRKDIDTGEVVRRLQNVTAANLGQAIHEEYLDNRDLIDSIYGGPDEFQKQVWDSMQYGSTIRPLGTKIEELPEEFLTLDQTPIYDLDQLAREVIDEMFGGNYTPLPVITWTNRPVSTYFGRYQPMPSPDLPRITINLLLNSKDVPREVIKYVLYHEMLHRDYRAHDKVFRGLEHRFPDWTKWDSFLDVTFPRFTIDPYGKADVQSAMSAQNLVD